jgi:hypothetical protein
VFALRLALKRRREAGRLAVVIVLASAAFFWTDIHFERWQFRIGIATRDYWENGGKSEHYHTWWWYNDQWFP